FVPFDLLLAFGEFFAQRVGATADGGESLDFLAVELGPECYAALGQGGEAVAGNFLEVSGLVLERRQRLVDLAAQGGDLAAARLAELIEPVEAGNEFVELVFGDGARVPHLAGDVARRVGNDRQVV